MDGHTRNDRAELPPARCDACPLRRLSSFTDVTPEQLKAIQRARGRTQRFDAGAPIYMEGDEGGELLTLFDGWAIRYTLLPDGARQVLNVLLPGDVFGVKADMQPGMDHSVEAVTALSVCVFDAARARALFSDRVDLAWNLSWMLAYERALMHQHLINLGRRSAEQRVASLLLELLLRLEQRGMSADGRCAFPLTQTQLGDALGLANATVSRVLKALAQRGLVRVKDGRMRVLDRAGLMALGQFPADIVAPKPML